MGEKNQSPHWSRNNLMICIRCGYCCHHLSVVIVDDPVVGPVDGNLITQEGRGVPCKYLQGSKPGEYSCAVHNEPWYLETPCAAHTQMERSPNSVCRMGKHILGKGYLNDVAGSSPAHVKTEEAIP